MILIDTGPLVALCDARDTRHKQAVRQLQSFSDDEFGTCEAVLTETCFHLPHSSQRERLRALLREFDVAPVPSRLEAGFWLETFDWLARYAEDDPDWADACLAVLSGRDRHVRVWSYDREFRTIWRRPNGTLIPLA